MSTIAAPSWITHWRQRLWRLSPTDRDPVVLRHSRIYILPTRRGTAVIATLAIMLLTSMNYALSLGFALTFLCAGMVAAALLAAFRNLAGIAASPLVGGEAFAGSQLEFTISLSSAARARKGIEIAPRDGPAVEAELPAAATRPLRLYVEARQRGRVPLGRLTLSSNYPLGLWRAWAYVHFPLTGIVYPAPEASPPPLPAGHQGSDARRSILTSDAELAGLRDYQRGDAQNRIAWKAVARGAGWYTKLFEGAGGSGAIDLDWEELPPGMDAEQRLSRLAAWILAAERETRAFSLRLPGAALAQGQGAGHRRTALVALALYPNAAG
ncbi:MAG: DUF58 domain-containing protein [Betaproteobacteria bacterium]|nr:MAG: DUF58 domain-containing protein [Betaproteobacteria bacterium]